MELPIAKESYRPSADTLVRAQKRADVILARTAAEETDLESAIAFANPVRPNVRMINFAAEVRVPQGQDADAAIAEIVTHFRQRGATCHGLSSSSTVWPAPLAEAARRAGYRPWISRLYRLESYRPPAKRHAKLQIIPARAAYAEVHRLHERGAVTEWNADAKLAKDLADTHVDFLDESRLDAFLGRIDQKPAGIVTVLTLGNVGVICDVHTHIDFRRQGVAATLMDHAIDHCQRALFESVVLETRDDNEPACALYESLGFRLVTKFETYTLAAQT
jgi:ribosomal protein S18 acetylase RimI-like enzyme